MLLGFVFSSVGGTGRLEGLELDISLSQSWLVFGKTPFNLVLVKKFLLRAGFAKKKRMLWADFKMTIFLLLLLEIQWDFSLL